MPNHITNIVTFKGDGERVKALRAFIAGKDDRGEELIIDFGSIVPMPEELNIRCGCEASIAEGQKYFVEESDPRVDRAVLSQCRKNVKKYGAATWRTWNIKHWGTKWNAYSQREIEFNTIEFDTAGSTPVKVLEALLKKFPDVTLEVQYASEDIGHDCGIYKLKDGGGIVSDHWIPKGKTAKDFALKIKGWDPAEYYAEHEE